MPALTFALRHLLRYWRLNLVLLLGLTSATALLAGLSVYGDAVGQSYLRDALSSYTTPGARNICVSATDGAILDEQIYSTIRAKLGDILGERFALREIKLAAYQPLRTPGKGLAPVRFHFYDLWAFQGLEEKVRVVEGRFPVHQEPSDPGNTREPLTLEVAVGAEAVARTGVQVGDVLTATGPAGPLALYVVGVLEPLEPDHDRWWGDPRTFSIEVKLVGRSAEFITLSAFVPEETMIDTLPRHDQSWRILVDGDKITTGNARWLQETITNLQAQLGGGPAELQSSLPRILVDVQRTLATTRIALFLIATPLLALILYTLWTVNSSLLDRWEGELVSIAARGCSRLQITLVFALGGLVLALLAVLCGPWLAMGALSLWGLVMDLPLPVRLGAGPWLLALVAVGLGWLAIALPAYLATRQTRRDGWHRLALAPIKPAWQRRYVDLVLLLLGAVGVWQLGRSGSLLMSRIGQVPTADPFLLLSSFVLVLGVALALLRVLPHLANPAAQLAKQGHGLTTPLGLARLARAPLEPGRMVLLVSLATALLLFTNTFVSSLHAGQEETARVHAGADLRISSAEATAGAALESAADLPGVLVASPVLRSEFRDRQARAVSFMAVDPATFAQVAYYPPQLSADRPSIASMLDALQAPASHGALPAIVSRSALSLKDGIGTHIPFVLGGQDLTFEVRAIADSFPTLPELFIVTDWHALGEQIDLSLVYFRSGEIWFATDPSRHAELVQDPRLAGRILVDAQAELLRLQTDALTQGTAGAFELSSLMLGLLSVAGFLLLQTLAAHERRYEFGLLRAIGLAPGQLFGLLVAEGLWVIGLGLLLGTGLGCGLVWMLVPYLSRALATSLSGVEIVQVTIDWPAVLRLYTILVGGYALAMIGSLLVLRRAGLDRVVRLTVD
jgi:FtsX-like permease family